MDNFAIILTICRMTLKPEYPLFMPEKEGITPGITARNFSLTIGTKRLIEPSNFSINRGEKVALAGRNGSGKTTLLETIFGLAKKTPLSDEISFEGFIEVASQIRIGYLPQDVQIQFTGTVDEYLDSCAPKTIEALKTFERLSGTMGKTQINQKEVMTQMGEAMTLIDILDGWNYQGRKQRIIEGLGIPLGYLGRKIGEVSGGEATKIALAGVLIANPNMILLDEPTNNLDIQSVFFLEEWLKKQQGVGFIIVSHDRVFLDHVIGSVLEIDEESARVFAFGGNYSFYRKEKQKIYEARLRDYENALKKRKGLEKEAQRLKSAAKPFETISREAFFRRKGAKLQRKAVQLQKRAARISSEIPEPEPPKIPYLEVRETKEGNETIFSFPNLFFRYPKSDKEFFGGFNFSLHQQERVAIIGPNGVGKSTLLKIVLGELKPINLNLKFNPQMRVGYVPQSLILENPKENLLDFCRRFISGTREDINALIGKAIFTNPSEIRVGSLSLGELKRVLFTVVFFQGPDLLILDEPINHLDLFTAETLDHALERYNGAVLAVSHDRFFLQRLGAKRLLIIKQGKVIEKQIQSPEELIGIFEEVLGRLP